ncbi:MAG: DNA alkylation repair protein [Promethearchaeota archaeon]
MIYEEILQKLKSMRNEENRQGMARFGINIERALGISIYNLMPIAKEIGRNHKLALKLWGSGIHEARILAGYIDDPELVTEEQMEEWVLDFNSWDICDQVCTNLFDRTEFARKKVHEWSKREEEFVKRAAFTIIAGLAVHDKKAKDVDFEPFFEVIKRESYDERNFVKKAINWALRNIGKRNLALNRRAIQLAEQIGRMNSRASRWIATNALRELKSEKVKKRLRQKK